MYIPNKEIIGVLKYHDELICHQNGTECTSRDFAVTHREDIPNTTYEFVKVKYASDEESEYHPAETSVLVSSDGLIFCTEDWDFHPEEVNMIGDYKWICANNEQEAIFFAGLPRLFF